MVKHEIGRLQNLLNSYEKSFEKQTKRWMFSHFIQFSILPETVSILDCAETILKVEIIDVIPSPFQESVDRLAGLDLHDERRVVIVDDHPATTHLTATEHADFEEVR